MKRATLKTACGGFVRWGVWIVVLSLGHGRAQVYSESAYPPASDSVLCITVFDGSRPYLTVWEDGVFLMWPLQNRPEFCLIGRYEVAQVKDALDAIEKSGFLSAPMRSYVVPDAQWKEIYARRGASEVRVGWHGYINPGFGGDLNEDEEYRVFIARWNATLAAVTALAPTEVHRYADVEALRGTTEFRGVPVADARMAWPPFAEPGSN